MTLLQDIRFAGRTMLKAPGVFGVSVLGLALAIGSNTAVFTVVNAVLLESLPYADADRIVVPHRALKAGPSRVISVPKFFTWKDLSADVLANAAAYDFRGPGVSLSHGGVAEPVKAIHVTREFFAVFGVNPALGRFFSEDEDRPRGPRVAILGHGLWNRRFAGDPQIVGGTVLLSGEPHTIVGIAAAFESDPPAEVFLPLQADPATTNQTDMLWSAARLRPGVTLGAATARLKLAAEEFRRKFPAAMTPDETVIAVPLREVVTGKIRPALLIILGAVFLVQLIACANVASLLLVRGVARAKEMALRSCLGASRFQLARYLVVESVLVALAGGALGLVLGYWGLKTLLSLTPPDIPRAAAIASAGLNPQVIAFTGLLSLVAALLFGTIPIFQIFRSDLTRPIREGGGGGSAGRGHAVANSSIVVIEMALSLVLLIGAGLLIRSAVSLNQVSAGFRPDKVLSFRTSLGSARYMKTAAVTRFSSALIERVESLPGVRGVANATTLPTEGGPMQTLRVEGRDAGSANADGLVAWRATSPKYFEVLQIAVLAGRVFSDADTGESLRVAVVNRTVARRYWPDDNAVGQTIRLTLGRLTADPPRVIVGVVDDVHELGLERDTPPVVYVPQPQVLDVITAQANRIIGLAWVVKTGQDPMILADQIRRAAGSIDPQEAIFEVTPLQDVVRKSTASRTFALILLSVFAGVAVVLAAIGILGVVAYTLQQRTHEIAIRAALGAQAGRLLLSLWRHALALTLGGLVCGVAGAWALTRLLRALLFGVTATDPLVFTSASLTIGAIALIATWWPARRAAHTDPSRILRRP